MFFTCFCASVAFGPVRVTGGVGGDNKFVPKVHPNGPAISCLAGVLGCVVFINTYNLVVMRIVPCFFGNIFNTGISFNKASLVVVMNIMLRAVGGVRSRVLMEGCAKFLGGGEWRLLVLFSVGYLLTHFILSSVTKQARQIGLMWKKWECRARRIEDPEDEGEGANGRSY